MALPLGKVNIGEILTFPPEYVEGKLSNSKRLIHSLFLKCTRHSGRETLWTDRSLSSMTRDTRFPADMTTVSNGHKELAIHHFSFTSTFIGAATPTLNAQKTQK